MKRDVIVLCSGGPDGAVAAAILKAQGYTPTFLHLFYGQRSAHPEFEGMMKMSKVMNIPFRYIRIDEMFRSLVASPMLEQGDKARGKDLCDMVAYVPMRNLIFLSIAASLANGIKANYVATGNIKGGRYWDNQPNFTEKFDAILNCAAWGGVFVRALAPCNELSKEEVIQKGLSLRVPLEHSWSCYLGGKVHCGECASCLGRRKAYIALGVVDPTQYAAPLPDACP